MQGGSAGGGISKARLASGLPSQFRSELLASRKKMECTQASARCEDDTFRILVHANQHPWAIIVEAEGLAARPSVVGQRPWKKGDVEEGRRKGRQGPGAHFRGTGSIIAKRIVLVDS